MSPDEYGTPEMFELPAQPARSGSTGDAVTASSAQRAVTSATCPSCHRNTDVGLVRSGTHLVYREHLYPTWSGAQMTCRASGVAACMLPVRGQRSPSTGSRPKPVCQHP